MILLTQIFLIISNYYIFEHILPIHHIKISKIISESYIVLFYYCILVIIPPIILSRFIYNIINIKKLLNQDSRIYEVNELRQLILRYRNQYQKMRSSCNALSRQNLILSRALDTLKAQYSTRISSTLSQINQHEKQDIQIIILKEKNQFLELSLVQEMQYNKARSNFLSAMVHDLKTPLSVAIGFCDIMNYPHVHDVKQYTKDISSSCYYLLDMINYISDLFKIEAGIKRLNISIVDLNQSIRTIRNKISNHHPNIAFKILNNSQKSFIMDRKLIDIAIIMLILGIIKIHNSIHEISFSYITQTILEIVFYSRKNVQLFDLMDLFKIDGQENAFRRTVHLPLSKGIFAMHGITIVMQFLSNNQGIKCIIQFPEHCIA